MQAIRPLMLHRLLRRQKCRTAVSINAGLRPFWSAAGPNAKARGNGSRGDLPYYAFPEEHWGRIRTNNPIERILREVRQRTRVVGAFPDGQSALNLALANAGQSAAEK